MLQENGYSIVESKQTVIPFELILSLSPRSVLLKILNPVVAVLTWMMPGLFGYQLMFVARSDRPSDQAAIQHAHKMDSASGR